MQAFRTFALEMLRYRSRVAAAMVFAIISALGLGVGLLGIAPILDQILGQGRSLREIVADLNVSGPLAGRIPQGLIDALPIGDFTSVVWIVIGLGILTVLGGTANFLHMFFAQQVVHRTVTDIRARAFGRVIHLPLRTIVTRGSADPISRIINDPIQLGVGFSALLSKIVAQVTKGVAAFAVAFIVEWRLTLVSLIVAPILYTVIRKLGKRIRRSSRAALRSQAGLYGAASETVQGLRVVKVHTTESSEQSRFDVINERVYRELLRMRTARALASPLVEVISILVLGALSLIAVRAIQTGALDAGDFILALGSLGVAGSALKPITALVNDVQQSAAAADRLAEIIHEDTEPGRDGGLPAIAPHQESITFDGVTFSYPESERAALNNISLTVKHGETVAIVGPNGSGKTTLLALVARLFDPDQGTVRVDGTDIASVQIMSLRQMIGVVTQETVLFHASIRDNIGYGQENPTHADIVAAATDARAHEFIELLPESYDTVVGERGMTLSGGQRQRVAIARAILRNPAILILDEATSMIDADSEAQISAAISEFSRGRTCLVVAHRLSTVLNADRIVVMDDGRIIDQGSHDELLGRCETYRLIAQHQLVTSS